MALVNNVVNTDVTALFGTYAREGLTTSAIDGYIASAFTHVKNMLTSLHGVDPDTITEADSDRFKLAIVYKCLELIFEDLRVDEAGGSDRWSERQDDYEAKFVAAWDALQYGIDTDADDVEDTILKNGGTLNVSRS